MYSQLHNFFTMHFTKKKKGKLHFLLPDVTDSKTVLPPVQVANNKTVLYRLNLRVHT